jgi:endoglucanase
MQKLLNQLCVCSGVSSREEAVRAVIRTLAEPYADSMQEDAMGNLIVHKKGRVQGSKRVVLSGYMDETGVMVSSFTDDGYIRFQTVGNPDRRNLIGKTVFFGEKNLPGVIGMKPIHLTKKGERSSVPATKSLYIDVGAKTKQEAEKLLEQGDVGHFQEGMKSFGKNCWKGKTLDGRIGCAVLLKLLQEELPMDCTFVFGVQELVETGGAYGAAYRLKPHIVLSLGSVAAGDQPLTDQGKAECALGKGVVLPVSDKGTQYDRRLFEQLRQLAEEEQIPWQVKAAAPELSGARAYQRSRSGVRVAGLALPVRYLYAPVEVASLEDAEGMLRLSRVFLTAMAEENNND